MADHHNGSECRKGRKEGCWSVGSLQAPGSGQPDEDAEGWSLSRTQGGGNENQRKRRCTTGSKEEQQHQPVASQLSTSAHAQFQFSRKSKTRKHGRVLSYYWVRFPPPSHVPYFEANGASHREQVEQPFFKIMFAYFFCLNYSVVTLAVMIC